MYDFANQPVITADSEIVLHTLLVSVCSTVYDTTLDLGVAAQQGMPTLMCDLTDLMNMMMMTSS